MTTFREELIFQNSKKFYAPHSTSNDVEKNCTLLPWFLQTSNFCLKLIIKTTISHFVYAVCVSETVHLLVASAMVKH